MKKTLSLLALAASLILSWSCVNNTIPLNPYYGGSGPVVVSNPTIAPTQSPTPPFISSWQASAPNGMAAGNGYIYAAEGDAASVSQIQLFDSGTNASVAQWAGYGTKPFYIPSGVAVNNTTGNVYVLDAGNPRDEGTTGAAVYEFGPSSSGTGITSWTGYGSTSFNSPAGIALDSNGNVYVADMDNYQVEEFASGGATLGVWNAGNNRNFWPAAVALDTSNNLYVLDAGNFKVWELPSITGTATSWNIFSNNDNWPSFSLSVDGSGNIYVADYDRGVVDVYTNGGALISEMNGNFGSATPFSGPNALLLFNGNIYVGDYDRDNIQIFGPNTY